MRSIIAGGLLSERHSVSPADLTGKKEALEIPNAGGHVITM
jgi:hypothetical protein